MMDDLLRTDIGELDKGKEISLLEARPSGFTIDF